MIALIQGGMSELRKDIHPQNPTGPQHNGWDAVEDFANWLLKTAAADELEHYRNNSCTSS